MGPRLNGARHDHNARAWDCFTVVLPGRKTSSSMTTLSFVAFALVSIQWVLIGNPSHSDRMLVGL